MPLPLSADIFNKVYGFYYHIGNDDNHKDGCDGFHISTPLILDRVNATAIVVIGDGDVLRSVIIVNALDALNPGCTIDFLCDNVGGKALVYFKLVCGDAGHIPLFAGLNFNDSLDSLHN